MIGPLELLIVLLVVVVLFSSRKIPDVMSDLGKAVSRFKQGISGKDESDKDPDDKPPMTAAMEPDEYDKMHAVEERMWWYRGLHANLLSQLGRRRLGPLLDAGCGTGGLLKKLGEAGIGLDYSTVAARFARAKSGRPVVVGSINDLPFAAGAFAAVVSADVLANRSVDEARALAEMHRCLAPAGVIVLNLPAYGWLASDHDRRVHQVRRYTSGRLARLLQAAGFRAIFTTYWNTILFPLMVVRRLLLSGSGGDVQLPRPVETVFQAAVAIESRLIARGKPLPFGGSVLAVGVKDG